MVIGLVLLASLAPITHTVTVDVVVKPRLKTKVTWEDKKQNKAMAMRFAQVGWGWDKKEQACVYTLFMAESKFDHLSDNPKSSAFGIGQVLKETSKDPAIQILRAYRYIEYRYGTPCKALQHHKRKNWY